ncbi:MAG: hypothetical protein ACC628_21570 [Pirellulaceae bacterium]
MSREEDDFLEVSRYIHLNPERAKMAARPEEYRWSSYRGSCASKRGQRICAGCWLASNGAWTRHYSLFKI